MKDLKTELKQHFIKAYANQHLDSYAGYLEDWDINAVIAAADLEFDTFTAANPGWYYEAIKNVIIPEFTNRAALMEMYKKRNEYLGIPANYGFPLDHFWNVKEAKFTHGSVDDNDKNIKETFNVGIDWGFGQIDSHNDVIMPGAFKKFDNRKSPFDISKYSTPVRSLIDMKFSPLTEEEVKQKVKQWRQHSLNMDYKKNPAIKDTFEVKSEFKFKGFNGSDFPNDENNRRWMPLVENSDYADSIAYALFVYKLPAGIFEKLSVIEWFEAQGTPKHLSIAKRLREIIGNPYQVHDEIIIEA